MAVLLLILVVGGLLAWLSERINRDLPRAISLVVISVALVYLLNEVGALSQGSFAVVPNPTDASTWLMHLQLEWIPRFGISFQLAMDGLSLMLVV